jgi:hypothetical protein
MVKFRANVLLVSPLEFNFIQPHASHIVNIHWERNMQKILNSIEKLFVKSFWALGLASLVFTASFVLTQPSYAATPVHQAAPDVIQPFELTKPAATRSEAYDEIAKLNSDPKALIAAENKEEQAEEKLYKAEQKAAKSGLSK